MPLEPSTPMFEPEVRIWRYAMFTGVSTLLGTLLLATAISGTVEFLSLATISAIILGILPAMFTGAVAWVLVAVLLEDAFRLLSLPVSQHRRVGQCCVLFPLFVAVIFSINLMRPRHRLKAVLGTDVPPSAENIRVAGFSSFLARRWYSSFTISSNELPALVAHLDLIPSTNLDPIPVLIADRTFAPNALASGVIPPWKACARWVKSKQNGQRQSWSWLAVDETGTNAFFTRGYQN
jgi:hypothetical protein